MGVMEHARSSTTDILSVINNYQLTNAARKRARDLLSDPSKKLAKIAKDLLGLQPKQFKHLDKHWFGPNNGNNPKVDRWWSDSPNPCPNPESDMRAAFIKAIDLAGGVTGPEPKANILVEWDCSSANPRSISVVVRPDPNPTGGEVSLVIFTPSVPLKPPMNPGEDPYPWP